MASTVVVGFNVSCGSETSPGLDDNRRDIFRFSVKFPEMEKIEYIDVVLDGKYDPNGRGDTNRDIAAKVAAAVGAHIQSQKNPKGAIPANRANYIRVEVDPDPAHPNTAPGRIVFIDADEVDARSTQGKLKIDIFDPHPPEDKRKRVRVVTAGDPPAPPPPPPPPGKRPRGPITPPDRPWETPEHLGDAPRLPDNPYGLRTGPGMPKPGYSHPLREKYGGGGWLPFGFVYVARAGDTDYRVQGSADSVGRIAFPYVLSTPEAQASAIAAALSAAGIAVRLDGDSVVEVAGGAGPRVLGISTAYDPFGRGPAFPWDIALSSEGVLATGFAGAFPERSLNLPGPALFRIPPPVPAAPSQAPTSTLTPGGALPPGLRTPHN